MLQNFGKKQLHPTKNNKPTRSNNNPIVGYRSFYHIMHIHTYPKCIRIYLHHRMTNIINHFFNFSLTWVCLTVMGKSPLNQWFLINFPSNTMYSIPLETQSYTYYYYYHLGTVYGIERIPRYQLSLLNVTFIIFDHSYISTFHSRVSLRRIIAHNITMEHHYLERVNFPMRNGDHHRKSEFSHEKW